MVPRTGPLSASSALARTSWYHCGKSADCDVSTLRGDMAPRMLWRAPRAPVAPPRWGVRRARSGAGGADEARGVTDILTSLFGPVGGVSKRGRTAHASVF